MSGRLLGGEHPPSVTFVTARILRHGTSCFSQDADVEGTALPGPGGAGVGEGLMGSFCFVLKRLYPHVLYQLFSSPI